MLAAPAAASVGDFRLPGASPTQEPPPDRQGPVAPDVPESRGRPTPAPTARSTPAPTPAPTAAAPGIVVPDLGAERPAAGPARTVRAPVSPAPAETGEAPAASPGPAAAEPPILDPFGASAASPAPAPVTPAPFAASAPASEGGLPWLWILAGLLLAGVLGLFGLAWWRQRPVGVPSVVPEVVRPHVGPDAASGAGETTLPEPLQVTLEPLRLSLTLMNATLAYRLEVANRGAAPIDELEIGADMISAHASMTREQQLSGPGAGAATVQHIDRLEPGESRIVEGEFRLPFPQIVPIRQGNAALLLPLARFRLEAEGSAPVVRTFAVGLPGAKAALQPFRLDLGPRVYPKLIQRAFA